MQKADDEAEDDLHKGRFKAKHAEYTFMKLKNKLKALKHRTSGVKANARDPTKW